jgi:hypothetical protein
VEWEKINRARLAGKKEGVEGDRQLATIGMEKEHGHGEILRYCEAGEALARAIKVLAQFPCHARGNPIKLQTSPP